MPKRQWVPMEMAILIEREWPLHRFLLQLPLETVAAAVDDRMAAVAARNGCRFGKKGTIPFRNGTVFKEKRFYIIQRVCQWKWNPVGSRYHCTIHASMAVTHL